MSDIAPVIIRKSRLHGWGCFASHPLGARMALGYYGGPVYARDADIPDEVDDTYLWECRDGSCIDGGDSGWRFLNHSCAPNCEMVEDSQGRPWIWTLRRIHPGEELTIAYRIVDGTRRVRICRCGARNCRRRFT